MESNFEFDLYLEEVKNYYDAISRHEICEVVNHLLDKGQLVDCEPFLSKYEHAVLSSNRSSSGIIFPLREWKTAMGIMNFTEEIYSSANWMSYSMSGKDRARASASLLYNVDYNKNEVEHSFVIHYRRESGGFTVYRGNVFHFFEQVTEEVKKLARRKRTHDLGVKFGITD